MSRTVVVVSAGLRQPSSTRLLADRLADATAAALRSRGQDVDVEVVEVREVAHDLTNMLLTGFASAKLQAVLDAVVRADGLIAVSPIFSGSFSGMFKNFFDALPAGALAGRPVLLGATAGSARHSLALEHGLRPLFAYLGALTAPTAVFAATEDFGRSAGSTTDDATPLATRVDRAAEELAELVARAKPRTVSGTSPYELTADFGDLLNG
jgi:FMN reductase